MTYNPSIPAPTDNLSVSQGDIQANFSSANSSFGIDHFPFADLTADNGKHKWMHVDQIANYAAITPAPAASEGTVYVKSATSTGASTESNLFFSPDNSTNEYQLTRPVSAQIATFGTTVANQGWTFLPGGLILQYGRLAQNGTTTRTVTFSVTYTNVPFMVDFSSVRENSTSPGSSFGMFIDRSTVATTGFNIRNTSGHDYGFYWMAIGR